MTYRAAAAAKQMADEQTNVMQPEERLTAHVEAAIESRAGRWSCSAERQDAWVAARAKMTEEAKQVLKQHTESLKDLVAETKLKLQREELDKMDSMICDGFQDEGERLRLAPRPSLVKQLPERIKSRDSAQKLSDATVAKARGDKLHDGGSFAKTRGDEPRWIRPSRSSCRPSRAGA